MRKSFNRKEIWLLISPLFVLALAWSIFGGRKVSQQRQAAQHILDVKNGSAPRAVLHQNGLVFGLIFSPDGKTLASGELVNNAAFAKPDSRVAISWSPPQIYLWDTKTDALATTIPGKMTGSIGLIKAPAFAADSKAVVVVIDNKFRLWNISTRTFGPALSIPMASRANITKILPAQNGENIKLADKLYRSVDRITPHHFVPLGSLGYALSKSKRYFALEQSSFPRDSYFVLMYEMATGRKMWEFEVRHLSHLAFSPDEKTLFVSLNFEQWRQQWGPRPTEQPQEQHGEIMALNVATGKLKWKKNLSDALTEMIVSPDGNLVASRASFANRTFLIRASDGEPLQTFETPAGPNGIVSGSGGESIKFSPDGKTLATHDAQNIYLWNVNSDNLR